MPDKTEFISAMAKHLPPSASDLRLLDVGAVAGEILRGLRPDIEIQVASLATQHWDFPPESVDAVVAYDTLPKPDLLAPVLDVMRAGGRFILVNPLGDVSAQWVEMLESAGYIRILVEPAIGQSGVLIRGEKAHTTTNTLDRVETIASRDADVLNLDTFRGRFVHLLIIQTPNIPVWKRKPDDPLVWHAAAIKNDGEQKLLAFSSLPKAVNFMQHAVLEGFVSDVNKVGKFSKETARHWQTQAIINPTIEQVHDFEVTLLPIDPDSAEASDE